MRKLLFDISAVLTFVLVTSAAWGACHVMTPSGSGNLGGSDWNNACNGFSGACSGSTGMVRGDVYYIAKGTYSPSTMSRANSGTTPITIKAPTATDHCTDTGFNQATHVGQGVIQGKTFITSGYWVFDGQYGTPFSKGSYGLKFKWQSGNNDQINVNNDGSGSTFRYLELQGSNGAACEMAMSLYGFNSPGTNNVLIDHVYAYQNNSILKDNGASNVTLQHSVSAENYSAGSCHGENIALTNTTNTIIRYNKFVNCSGTACIANPSAVTSTDTNVQIYGNAFYDDGTRGPCENRGGTGGCLDNGITTVLGGGKYVGLKIYNNVIANWTTPHVQGNTLNLFGNFSGGQVSNLDIQNNIFYNNEQTDGGSGDATTCRSNSYYDTTRVSTACTGDQVTTGNPFVDRFGDFRLTVDTSPWTPLTAPYNVDPNNVTRVSSRGVHQFGNVQLPNPPSGLAATVR